MKKAIDHLGSGVGITSSIGNMTSVSCRKPFPHRVSRSAEENEDFRQPPDLLFGPEYLDGTEESPFFFPFGAESDLFFPMTRRGASTLSSEQGAAMAKVGELE